MNKINLKYYNSRYGMLLLVFFAIASFAVLSIFIFTNDLIINILEKHFVLAIICIFLFFLIILLSITGIGSKIISKNIQIIIYDDFFEIDSLEKYYYNNIIEYNLEIIKATRYDIITAYILKLKLNDNKNIKYIVFTGTSKKEKSNSENLLMFYDELSKKLKIDEY
jgi:hypothetical protein